MKLLYLIDSLKTGGKERQIIELLKGVIDNKQIKVKLVIMNKDVLYPEVYDSDIDINFLIRSSKRDIRIFFELYHLCKTFKPDIIHTWDSMTSFYSLPIAKWFKIKLINGSIRNATPPKLFSFGWFFSTLTFSFSDKIVSNSLAGLKQYNTAGRNGLCIYNGFDFNRISVLKPRHIIKESLGINKEKVVGMVASFSKNKDYDTFITAAQNILSKRKDVSFVCVGEGQTLKQIKKQVLDCNKHNIIFTGRQESVESIINIFDFGVLSTYTEGISNSIMEYMALGKPVVATNGGGTNELVIDKKTGFLVPERCPSKMAEKIEYLLDNEKSARQMGKIGRKIIESKFNMNRMVSSYYFLYKKLFT